MAFSALATDRFKQQYADGSAMNWPATQAAIVTPSDSVDLASIPRGLYIGVAGDVKVDMYEGGTVVFKAVPVGILSIRPRRVWAAGTTATNILALE